MTPYEGPQQLNEYPPHKGGDTCMYGGYVWEYFPTHHLANRWGWVAQHRLVGETMLGRALHRSANREETEVVHHKDEKRWNNDPDNLQVMTHGEHRRLHARKAAEKQKSRLTSEMVKEALIGRSIKDAAAFLQTTHMTLRNRFPEEVAHRKRRSPVDVKDPKWPDLLRPYAADPGYTQAETMKILGISLYPIQKICRKHGIKWIANKSEGRTGRPKGSKNRFPRKPNRIRS